MSNAKYRELFTDEEWTWMHNTSKAIHDPKEKKEFWENAINAKNELRKIPNQEENTSPAAKVAKRYAGEILEMLKRGKSDE